MPDNLSGKRVALFAEDLFEDSELLEPLHFLQDNGAKVSIIGSGRAREFRGKNGAVISVDADASTVSARDFDAIIVPGGYAPGKMRRSPSMIRLIAEADDQGIIIAAVCHGPQMLISADILHDRIATSVDTIAVDVKNAGAHYVDEAVVVDGNLITSRTPADLAEFNDAILAALNDSGKPVRQPMIAGA